MRLRDKRAESRSGAPARSGVKPPLAPQPAHPVQVLRGLLGNRLTGRLLENQRRDGLSTEGPHRVMTHAELAAALRGEHSERMRRINAHGAIRFRLPTTADLKKVFTGGLVPEKAVKDSIETALTRMAKEGRLKTSDPVPTIMSKVFPSPGKFDETEYEKAVDVTDRSKVYKTVMDAQTKIEPTDKPKLISAKDDALSLIDDCIADAANLKLVFGSKDGEAKVIYGKAKKALQAAFASIDTAITTDYNFDDPETNLGGWASFSSKEMHLELDVVKVKDLDETKITLIHESSHLADPKVDDNGYYGSKGFEAMTENEKIANAAHFEEIPRRKLGKSIYGDAFEFKPGVSKAGTPVTFEDKVKRRVGEYLRKAWDKAVDVHGFLRGIRKDIENGSTASFTAKKWRILEISRLMHLTVHQQPAATATLTTVDVVLAEGVAHGIPIIRQEAGKQTVPNPPTASEDYYVLKIINDSIAAYNALTGSFVGDRMLMDWLVAEYRKDL